MLFKENQLQSKVDQEIDQQANSQLSKDYEILKEDNINFDICFKIIVIGNAGN